MTAPAFNYSEIFHRLHTELTEHTGRSRILLRRDTPARFSTQQTEIIDGMVWIPAGTFTMGGTVRDFMHEWPYFARSRDDERPLHSVTLSGFWISETPVTNRQFKAFVDATDYITTAEKAPKLEDILPLLPPGTPPPPKEALIPASLVFDPPDQFVPLNNPLAWWQWKKEPIGTTLRGRAAPLKIAGIIPLFMSLILTPCLRRMEGHEPANGSPMGIRRTR